MVESELQKPFQDIQVEVDAVQVNIDRTITFIILRKEIEPPIH